MATDTVEMDATDRVGSIRMHIAFAEQSPESEARWACRIDALAAWLVAEWDREHADRARERQ